MFISANEVMQATGYTDVTAAQVQQAQFVIEIVCGRTEAEVTKGRDKMLLARAVAAQVIYMRSNPEITFEQIKVSSLSRGEGGTAFSDDYSPFVAPLALISMLNLSWRVSRSVRTGKTFQRSATISWRRD